MESDAGVTPVRSTPVSSPFHFTPVDDAWGRRRNPDRLSRGSGGGGSPAECLRDYSSGERDDDVSSNKIIAQGMHGKTYSSCGLGRSWSPKLAALFSRLYSTSPTGCSSQLPDPLSSARTLEGLSTAVVEPNECRCQEVIVG